MNGILIDTIILIAAFVKFSLLLFDVLFCLFQNKLSFVVWELFD